MAGIIAASVGNPFGNAMGGISQVAKGIQEETSEDGDLEGRVAQLESVQTGGAGGGEVAGVAGMTQRDIDFSSKFNGIAQSINNRKAPGPMAILNQAKNKARNGVRGGWNSAL